MFCREKSIQGYRSHRTLYRDINGIAIDEVEYDEIVERVAVYIIYIILDERAKPRETGDIRNIFMKEMVLLENNHILYEGSERQGKKSCRLDDDRSSDRQR